jgi:hypothetical protein
LSIFIKKSGFQRLIHSKLKEKNHSDKPIRRKVMEEIVHISRIKIVREKGPTRRAMIEGFNEPIYYGVHGGIKRFYQIEPEKEHAATLDHIVAATAG